MVKLPKRFSVGERVFAKVRGYPPWPAKIQNISDPNTKNAKYHVIFFGTKEIGTCKVDDLFQYADNKEKFSKSVRRKFFQEGLQELEEDLKNDPSANISLALESTENVPENSIENDLSEIVSGSLSAADVDNLVIDEPEKKKVVKRKSQNIQNTPDVSEAKKKRGRKSMAATTVVSIETTPKQDSALESQDEDGEKKNVSRSGRKIKPKKFHDSIEAEISIDASKNDHIVRIKTKNKADDQNSETPVAPPKKRAFDEREDKKKEETEAQLQSRLNILRTEEQLTFLDTQIRSSLGLEHANTDDCLDAMNQLLDFPFTPFMLKKYSHVVETIKRLRRYVGNLHDWKLSDEEVAAFKEKADHIKKKAETIYEKFKSLFVVPEGQTFWASFSEQVTRLKECTKDMTQEEFFALLEDPSDSTKTATGKAKQAVSQASVLSPVAGNSKTPAAAAEDSLETETSEEAGMSGATAENAETNMS